MWDIDPIQVWAHPTVDRGTSRSREQPLSRPVNKAKEALAARWATAAADHTTREPGVRLRSYAPGTRLVGTAEAGCGSSTTARSTRVVSRARPRRERQTTGC
ncbi:DUF6207 family protein [Streptomyces sp. NPDC020192]|uniref:DUF6207 family protein n=1 Tax=Streptomyces sp. NPDC020192 TaxID=3365066 RepID=UPI0037919F5D